ncbi:coiled-coil domain-containing protein 9 isoform X2 [Dunckerocampus dactyliophorus]|uniref:coiled-coil domain-containing protein 9 isoform X2 n=1 Tax=Dunckerocampus dactyliophorus TaxID=161453 RepID=UPI0024076BC3|nr:coiled-coil domain-containing protein 9 isoform X2 [Dunckerocampus dactyliophorus]
MSSAVDLKTKEEKDAELDKRIEALRKKNEALVKRYQEIEEDKKKAEQEGIAVTTPRKPRPHEPELDRRKTEKENFTLAVDPSRSSSGDARVVDEWKPPTPRGRKASEENDGHSPPRRTGSGRVGWGGGPRGGGGGGRPERREREPRTPRGGEPAETGGQGRRGGRRGRGAAGGGGGDAGGTPGGVDRKSKEWEEKRRQNIEKMNEEMERIAEYERGQRDGDKPIRNFLDDPRRSGPAPDTDRKEGSRRHIRNWGGLDFDNVKTGADLEKEWTSRRPGPRGSMDMTMSMTGRERAEYLRWKKEREQIDEERLARHRNATGQWRREWDAQKTENMFKEDAQVAAEGVTAEQGGRRARGRNFRGEPRGRASDDGKRPPKTPTFGDFLSQGRPQGSRGDRSRGKGRGQRPSYSMHDNRWEGEKEDEETEKKDKPKREKNQKEKDKSKPPPEEKAVEAGDEEDEDQWEDASDGEQEGSDGEIDSRGDEKKDAGKDDSPTTPSPCSRPTAAAAGSPKEQRTPRPKVHIPSPSAASQGPSEAGKPVSPFSPLDGHQPVSDWGEEMEMLSPRSSMGGESPLKPPSAESSPAPKEQMEDTTPIVENTAAQATPEKTELQQAVTASEPESTPADPLETPPSLPELTPSEVSDPARLEVSEDSQGTAATHSQDKADSPPPAVLVNEPTAAEAGRDDNNDTNGDRITDATTTSEISSEQPTSG